MDFVWRNSWQCIPKASLLIPLCRIRNAPGRKESVLWKEWKRGSQGGKCKSHWVSCWGEMLWFPPWVCQQKPPRARSAFESCQVRGQQATMQKDVWLYRLWTVWSQFALCSAKKKKPSLGFLKHKWEWGRREGKQKATEKSLKGKKTLQGFFFFLNLLNDKQGIFTFNHAVQKETYCAKIYTRRISLPCIVLFHTARYF